jgi:hypothetical protein
VDVDAKEDLTDHEQEQSQADFLRHRNGVSDRVSEYLMPLTLWFELKPPVKFVTAMMNAAVTSASATIPIADPCTGNHHLESDSPLAYRGTRTAAGMTSMVANAPQTTCAMSMARAMPEAVEVEEELRETVELVIGVSSAIVTVPNEMCCWMLALEEDDLGLVLP